MQITVSTFDNRDDETPETERTVDFEDGLQRKWLFKHLTWAVNAGKTVEVSPDDD